uniref:Secreted protein n=1 Tax=Ixodes ricinus TaxID=34613 RepID=A0A6B0U6I0_IXORI
MLQLRELLLQICRLHICTALAVGEARLQFRLLPGEAFQRARQVLLRGLELRLRRLQGCLQRLPLLRLGEQSFLEVFLLGFQLLQQLLLLLFSLVRTCSRL